MKKKARIRQSTLDISEVITMVDVEILMFYRLNVNIITLNPTLALIHGPIFLACFSVMNSNK